MDSFFLADEAATGQLARQLARFIDGGMVLYLEGDLGAGKTFFVRHLLRALGVAERVKSPTYSLVEAYRLPVGTAWHLDLYRIGDAEELLWLGLDELSDPQALVLVEWPARGAGFLPEADLVLHFEVLPQGRQLTFRAHNPRAQQLLERLAR